MSPCGPARLEFTYDASPGEQNRAFTFAAIVLPAKVCSLRKIDLDLFRAVTEKQQFDDEPKWLALEWFRKGLAEEHTLDEFIAYLSALEILARTLKSLYATSSEKSYPYCPACREKVARVPSLRRRCRHCLPLVRGLPADRSGDWVGSQRFWCGAQVPRRHVAWRGRIIRRGRR